MQRKTKLFMAGGVAALLAIGGLAGLAQADKAGGWGEGWHGMGGMHRMWGGHGRGGMMGQEMMQRYDTGKDGKLTQQEIDQNRAQAYAEFDADKNAGLSLDEFRNLWLKQNNERMVREFQFFDADGNGQLTLDEYKAPLSSMVAQRDRNGDGALSPEDRPMRGEGRHHRWGDGEGPGKGQGMGQGMGGGMGQGMDDDEGGEPPAAPATP